MSRCCSFNTLEGFATLAACEGQVFASCPVPHAANDDEIMLAHQAMP